MTNTPSSTDATTYLEISCGRAKLRRSIRGRSRIAMGVHGEERPSSTNLFLPFALIADLQREYFKAAVAILELHVSPDVCWRLAFERRVARGTSGLKTHQWRRAALLRSSQTVVSIGSRQFT